MQFYNFRFKTVAEIKCLKNPREQFFMLQKRLGRERVLKNIKAQILKEII